MPTDSLARSCSRRTRASATTCASSRATTSPPSSAELERFRRFCSRLIGLDLEPFQLRIAEAAFGPQREVVFVLPRGNGKSRLTAALAVFHLVTHPEPQAYIGAASRDQAEVVFDYAKRMARLPALAARVTIRHRELRVAKGHLRVLASDGQLAHGLTPTLCVSDEQWAHKDAELLEAFQTGLVKRSDSKVIVISTAAARLDSPLGRLRSRALAQPSIRTEGALTDASGPDLRLLEWSLPDDAELDDLAAVNLANPASWIDTAALRRQRESVPEAAFAQFHACRWGVGAQSAWLAPGAWAACAEDYEIEPGEPVWIGLDIGGRESDTAVVYVTEDLRVGVRVFQGDEGVVEAGEAIRELAETYEVREVAADPWRSRPLLLDLEADSRLVCVDFPQTSQRMVPATSTLYEAITHRKLRHPDDPALNAHVANTVTTSTPRGHRIDKAGRSRNNDGAVALALAVDRASQPPEELELVGWLGGEPERAA